MTDSWVIITFLVSRTNYNRRGGETRVKQGLKAAASEPGRVSLRACVSGGDGREDEHRPAE